MMMMMIVIVSIILKLYILHVLLQHSGVSSATSFMANEGHLYCGSSFKIFLWLIQNILVSEATLS